MNRPQQGSRWQEIERLANDLRHRIWIERELLWSGAAPEDEVHALEPGVALELLGYEVQSTDFLGEQIVNGNRSEVAGLIDQEKKIVKISRRFPASVQLFTAAHETGHAVLHPGVVGLHREMPLQGSESQVDWREREANRFAAFLLMPADLVESRFADTFGAKKFELTDETSFGLFTTSVERVVAKVRTRLDLCRKLAEANSYYGVRVIPLAALFGVSTTAMAIRLEELGLVGEIPHTRSAPEFLKRNRHW